MFEQIKTAAQRLSGYAHQTPVLSSSTLNRQLNAEIYFKCENFQRVGAFKFRGAFNSISQLSEEQKRNGVIAYSSGNHAQAVACVGNLLGVATTIVMPNNAPEIKLAATRGYGAKIVEYDPQTQIREDVAAEILSGRELTLIPPFDYEPVIAGQGTVAYEFLQSQPDLDLILAPCGGGGLLSGTAVAAKHLSHKCSVIGVEPELGDDATLSFRTGKLHSKPNPPTIADGTRTTSLGGLTFPLIQEYVDDMQTVSEEAIKEAVRFFFYRMKLVVEPSGALGLAALLSGVVKPRGKIGIIISGGNIDGETMSGILLKK
ncbi:threo-3-hydroxy-L-aspartate ammonia-lyase [Aliikangiella coralliicola]|uniref:Threo-3-hydroxy-L-aspartate ammonia-lyase n=1 Tax=Aliikangiella coralliicola TaxID=2592383 RepID=A0A545TW41_9GAMM|nr:threo-3-hydroxy-L-aspartate ammonia-lyase [Aliikangiella coralliicola]TQV81435.1 threo-3-hydroxy-L-aspartate ammonia-lyase [Aliikangiella coralliicola]